MDEILKIVKIDLGELLVVENEFIMIGRDKNTMELKLFSISLHTSKEIIFIDTKEAKQSKPPR